MSLTAERLREALSYDPDTGVWTWLLPTGRRVRAGSRAGRTLARLFDHLVGKHE
jgi:hypothetical protein